MIRVLIAEDQSMEGGALAALLDLEPDIEVTAQAADGQEALELLERAEAAPDVVITDIEMPRVTGLELAQALLERGDRPRVAGEGVTTAGIAVELHLSQGTVRNYLSEAIGKLDARNRIEAARVARAKGWL